MKLYDKDGNLVDAEGKILKTKEELEKENPPVKVPEIVVKDKDDLIGAVAEMAELMKDTAKTAGERLEAQKKTEGVLAGFIKKTEEFQTITEASLTELTEQQEIDQKSVFDIAMKAPVFEQWGYSGSVERSLYKTHTKWTPDRGWVHDGKAYDLDDRVYELNDMLFIVGAHNAIQSQTNPRGVKTYSQAVTELESYKLFKYELDHRPELRKALNTTDGADWVPTGMSAQLIDDLRLELKVAALFPSITIPAKSGAWEVPFQGSRQEAYLQGQVDSDSPDKYPAVTPGTGKVTFTAVKHALRMLFSDEMDEDSAIAIMPLVKMEIVAAIVNAHENACINADTTATHMDSDITSATSVLKSWLGLRKHGNNGSGDAAVDISSLTTANLRTIYKKMGRFGVNPVKRAWITGISGFIQMLSIDEVKTMDKFGSKATIRNGQLAQFDGSPIIVSEHMREDLNTSGVFDATTETDTEILCVYTPGFWNGFKPSGLRVETDRNIETGHNIAVASRRLDFEQVITPAGTSEETVGVGYSLTS